MLPIHSSLDYESAFTSGGVPTTYTNDAELSGLAVRVGERKGDLEFGLILGKGLEAELSGEGTNTATVSFFQY